MEITGRKEAKRLQADVLCVAKHEAARTIENHQTLSKTLLNKIDSAAKRFEFKGKTTEKLLLEGDKQFQRILVIGLGKKKEFDNDGVRHVSFLAAQEANSLKAKSLAFVVPGPQKHLKEACEGFRYGGYRFKGLRQKPDKDQEDTLDSVALISEEPKAKAILKEIDVVFDAVDLARNLVNLPSNIVTPSYLENQARSIAKGKKGVNITVLTENDAENHGMGAFLGVAQGSKEPAKMIALEYIGDPKSRMTYGVVGKGITFDSGGISLKPAAGMDAMKTDMAGGAAALGVFKAVVDCKLRVNLITVIAATENMPGGEAYRPGDILTASNGKTIEVANTDAEGRLVLADALVYAQKLGAGKIIDVATLTGACIVTFGNTHSALMSNNQKWTDSYLKAARVSGEKAWQLPMDKEYDDLVKSDVADVLNVTKGKKAGSIGGAKLLEKFIEAKTAWIHLDIAGTSYLDTPTGYLGKHATGVPIRTIFELLKSDCK
ncbi:MAG: leucyl aminopeptidase [Proteobacteria bacterium]|nr:leucyl aminopeptidase [Pseudomonadota bacterium]